ncbi:MAG: hypothetical protein NC218_10985 [Acetobacter sp.]|nr:hypothetical protein [Acetobacter sp.]
MANKQTVPQTSGSGVMALQTVRSTPIPVGLKREYAGNGTTEFLAKAAETGGEALEKKKEIDFEQMRYETDEVLQKYRVQLRDAQSAEEFDAISKSAEDDLKNRFTDRFNGPEFWFKNGRELLKANRTDVEKLREKKNFDFGKASLNEMLATSQNMLAHSAGDKGEKLVSRAVDEIDVTPFLSDEEKTQYRQGYLKTGILNLALNDPDKAVGLADKYLPEFSGELKTRIEQTRLLNEKYAKQVEEERLREKEIAAYQQAFSYWQAKEEGSLKPAEFYVLTAEDDADVLWGTKEYRSAAPLAEAYQTVKKINRGERLSAEEVRHIGNNLIAAYRQNKLSLDEVGTLHSQLMLAEGDKSFSGMLFDKDVDALTDRVFLADEDVDDDAFLEAKAKLAFQIYENYYSKKTALADEFAEQGGMITPALEKRFRKQALAETKAEMGIMENTGDDVSFAGLKRLLKTVYSGRNEREIWQRFYAEAPYVEDKKALFKRIGAEVERRELSYPQFDTLAALEEAALPKGARFYFKGRLAVKA